MDYLDPKKKRAHKQRLLIGYALFGILIAMSTVMLLFVANGYFIDRSTGEIIQNGLVFIDARPAEAEIKMNGKLQRGSTDARLVIPEGEYTFELSRDGYRPWKRTITLEGGTLRRLTYARLIPNELTSAVGVTLPADPARVSQSINKRWLLISYADTNARLSLVDLDQPTLQLQDLPLPENIVEPVPGGVFEVVEWADDNAHALLSYGVEDGVQQYVLLDRQAPSQAQNLSRLFVVPNLEIHLSDRKRDRFFVYDPATQLLSSATLDEGISATPFIDEQIIDFRTFASDWAVYLIASDTEGFVDARLRRGSQDILLKAIKTDTSYDLELAKLGNVPVIAIASPVNNPVTVFYDPEKYLAENKLATVAVAATIIRVDGFVDVTISSDSSTVMAYGTDKFASYEFEDDIAYSYSLGLKVDTALAARWMDGQHFSFSSGGLQHMVDFDGSNLYSLVNSMPSIGSFYSEDIETMITFGAAEAAQEGSTALPARLLTTRLVTPADE